MADPSDPSGAGEAQSFGTFVITDIAPLVLDLTRLQGIASSSGLTAYRDKVGIILSDLLGELNQLAVETAGIADANIVVKIFETEARNRPHTGEMATHIVSRPGPLGSVEVALYEELNKIVNERGYGPFWRAQEFGTGTEEVPSQEGRLLFGTFEPSGTPPDAAQRGLGKGQDLAFVPMGDAPGFGRISEELPGRHFLEDGTIAAKEEWLRRINELQDRYAKRVKELTAAELGDQGAQNLTRYIEA